MSSFFPNKFHLNTDVEPIRYESKQKLTIEIPAGQWTGMHPQIAQTTLTLPQPAPSDFCVFYFRNVDTDDCGTVRLITSGQWLTNSKINDPVVHVECRRVGVDQYRFTSEFSRVARGTAIPSDAVWTISQKQTIEITFNFLTSPFMLQ